MCQYETLLGWKCPFEPEPGKELCIFHLPLDQKEPKEFYKHLANYLLALYEKNSTPETKRFLQGIKPWILNEKDEKLFDRYKSYITPEAVWRFTGFVFPEMDAILNFMFFIFPLFTDFTRAKFQGADFTRAKFQHASFSGAEFHQNANFRGAEFHQDAYFTGAKFHQNANFTETKFYQSAEFSGTKFQNADFSWAEFHQNADFTRARFDGPVYFRLTEIKGKTEFTLAKVRNRLLFEGTKIGEEALILLWDLDFVHGVSDITLRDSPASLGMTGGEKGQKQGQIVEPAGQVVFKDISKNMNRVSFLHTEIFSDRLYIRFANVKWERSPEKFIYDAKFVFKDKEKEWQDLIRDKDLDPLCVIFNVPISAERKEDNDWFNRLRELVTADVERIAREIRRSTEEYGSYSDAGDYYIAEMDYRRKRTSWRNFLFRLALELYRLVSRYGEKPSHAAYWLIGIWLVPAGFYMFTGFGFAQREVRYWLKPAITLNWSIILQNLSDFLHALGYAFINLIPGYFRFLSQGTQGCGPVTPFIALIQAVLGVIVLALFLLAIRRRFSR